MSEVARNDRPLIRKLQPLDDFEPPPMPTEESIRQFGWKIWQWWRSRNEDPIIANKSLHDADEAQLDQLVAPPACGPILDELRESLADWLSLEQPSHWLQVIVLPPCDQNGVLQMWAEHHGYNLLLPPSRVSLLQSAPEIAIDKPENRNGLTVVPHLENWFLRHSDGLEHVIRLLQTLSQQKQHCVVGCSSWAWEFLCKATQAALILPAPITIKPFDANRLKYWLLPQTGKQDRPVVPRFSESGKSLERDGANGNETHDYFKNLAARSRGIPWVAWHLWRHSLRIGPGPTQKDEQKFPGERTIWVAPLKEFRIPEAEAEGGLLLLHSLLIHETLSLNELEKTLPSIERSNVLSGLIKTGFVQGDNGDFRCNPAAYPSIRSRLAAAGFPLDRF